ncbi:MAG TPA: amidohydrolase family protein [Candidatus Fermentibacter daniensis]|nr:amidohydrolase family protein [Candidatus Fermentibacter daniensis]HQH92417.1 amidohydrolase family protein [Candidatus Fermentibacter daniensis]
MELRTGFAMDWESGLRRGGFRIEVEGGRISEVATAVPDGPYSRCIAIPGLVQPHVHLCQTLFRGTAEGRTLMEWLSERIWPLESAHTPDTLATSVLVSLREIISSGCTALLDVGSVEGSCTTVDILRRSGIRAHAANALMDAGPACLARDLAWLSEETDRVSAACGGLVRHALAPRFALSCSDGLWEWVAGLGGGRIRTTHCAESPAEVEDQAIAGEGGNVRFLQNRGFLGPSTVLAHCIHLSEGEPEILAATGTAAAHCPWTNLRLGSGIADVPGLLSHGVRVLPASDGAACNNRLDLASDARLGMALMSVTGSPAAVSGRLWLKAATETAGGLLGTGHGRISEGFAADLVLIEPSPEEAGELEAAEDPVRFLLELDWPSRVRLVMVDGVVLYDCGSFPTLPPLPLRIAEARREVLQRAGADA